MPFEYNAREAPFPAPFQVASFNDRGDAFVAYFVHTEVLRSFLRYLHGLRSDSKHTEPNHCICISMSSHPFCHVYF